MKTIVSFIFFFLIKINSYAIESDPLWERYISSKIKFQESLAELFVESNPEYKELIYTSRDLQIVLSKIRQKQYYFLLEYKPHTIIMDQGVSKWSNFYWDEHDQSKLRHSSSEYAELLESQEILSMQNQDNPNWLDVREAFTKVISSKKYNEILFELMTTTSEIEKELELRNR